MNPLWVSTGFLALGTDIKPTELTSTEKHTVCHTALAIHVTSYNHAHISSYKAIHNVTIITPCIMWMCSFGVLRLHRHSLVLHHYTWQSAARLIITEQRLFTRSHFLLAEKVTSS